MRILFVVPPLVGHINPTVSLGRALRDRGHDVAWVGYPAVLTDLLPDDAEVLPLTSDMSDDAYQDLRSRGAGLRGAAAFKFLWEDLFFPLTRAMTAGVDDAVSRWQPDVIVHDQQTFAGAIVARQRGLPWVTCAATSANLVDPFANLPQLRDWYQQGMVDLQTEAGLGATVDGLISPTAVLAWSTPELVGQQDFPAHWHFVGPPLAPRRADVPFPWDALDPDRRRVLVSLGTVNADAGARFFAEAAAAVEAVDAQGIFVAPDGMVTPPPGSIVRAFLPQLELLPHVHAVICHAGHNTTVEALSHGLPLVVAPIRDDQPVVAAQVADAGAGIRVRFGRVKAAKLTAALRAVLDEPSYRQAATRIRASFEAAGGVEAAADVIVSGGTARRG